MAKEDVENYEEMKGNIAAALAAIRDDASRCACLPASLQPGRMSHSNDPSQRDW